MRIAVRALEQRSGTVHAWTLALAVPAMQAQPLLQYAGPGLVDQANCGKENDRGSWAVQGTRAWHRLK